MVEKAEIGVAPATDQARASLMMARRRKITELVEMKRVVRVTELVELFGVSDVTIRNDLEALAKEGVLVRDHGGAVAQTRTGLSTAFDQRALLNLDAKQRIGEAAAAMVRSGETIIMDAGTTLMEMAKRLRADISMTVITNSLNIATEIGSRPQAHVILAGGSLSTQTISTVGPLAERDISELLVDTLFLGIQAFEPESGLSDVSLDVARVKATMIAAATRVVLLADSTKFPTRAFARVAPLAEIDCLITDQRFPEDATRQLTSLGISVHRI
jgi:DeoR family transcriptional regulator, aga operon transcriptional repressor